MRREGSTKEIEERIIDTLRVYGELNITRLVRLTGLHYRVLQKHLTILMEKGMISERRFGRLRLFSLKKKTLKG
jgi:DNA-binding transcriptional ArsR family regulator